MGGLYLTAVDEAWALSELRHFTDLMRLQQPRSGGGLVYMIDFATPVGQRSNIVASAQVVEQISIEFFLGGGQKLRTTPRIAGHGTAKQHKGGS